MISSIHPKEVEAALGDGLETAQIMGKKQVKEGTLVYKGAMAGYLASKKARATPGEA